MKITGNWQTKEVKINGENLSPRRSQKLCNHSLGGFSWGYGGSGPLQLALALMLHFTDNDKKALKLYYAFTHDVVAKLDQDDFELHDWFIQGWIRMKESERNVVIA